VTDWVKRPYDGATDEDAICYLWLKSYAHSRANVLRGAHRDRSEAERRYWREHAPIVECLLRTAQVEVLCDPNRATASKLGPPVILAFACTSGDVVHYVCVKRDYARAGFGAEMAADLLGDRMKRACTFTHELVEMKPRRDRETGETFHPAGPMPSSWTEDTWWLARALVGGARAA
jgi:hypothetical protein